MKKNNLFITLLFLFVLFSFNRVNAYEWVDFSKHYNTTWTDKYPGIPWNKGPVDFYNAGSWNVFEGMDWRIISQNKDIAQVEIRSTIWSTNYPNNGISFTNNYNIYDNGTNIGKLVCGGREIRVYKSNISSYSKIFTIKGYGNHHISSSPVDPYGLEANVTSFADFDIFIPKPKYTLNIIGDEGVERIEGNAGIYEEGQVAWVKYHLKPGYQLVKQTGTCYGSDANCEWTDNAGQTGIINSDWTMMRNRTAYIHTRPNVLTINHNLNGGVPVPGNGIITGQTTSFSYKYSDNNGMLGVDGLLNYTNDRVVPPTGRKAKGYWNTAANGSGQNFDTSSNYRLEDIQPNILKGDASITLYAQWTSNEYVLTLFPEGGKINGSISNSLTLSPNLVYHGSNWWNINGYIPTKEGYTFMGWYSSVNGGEKVYGADGICVDGTYWTNRSYNYPGSLNVYARWKPNQYTLTFNPNGGTVSPTNKVVSYNEAYGTLPMPTKTGYVFQGWYTDPSGGSLVNENTKMGLGNKTIYAHWSANAYTYNIIYKSSTGTHLGSSTISGTFNSSKVISPPNINGYTTPPSQNVVFDTPNTKTITFIYPIINYTINYNLNGGSGTNRTSYNIETPTFTLVKPTKTGHTFSGWTGTGLSNITENVSIYKGSVGNKNFTANWGTNQYLLTYNPNGGTVNPQNKYLSYGSQYGILPTPTRTGYTFLGWYTEINNGNKVNSITTMEANDTTIYAHWRQNKLIVNYYPNGGMPTGVDFINNGPNNPMMTEISYYGDKLNGNDGLYNPTETRIKRTGYMAVGYNTQANGNGRNVNYDSLIYAQEVEPSLAYGDRTLNIYVQWNVNQYKITFDPNGGTVNQTSKLVSYGSQYGLLPTPTRKNYNFVGWYTSPIGGTKVSSTTIMESSNITLYAHWEKQIYYVQYVGGANSNGNMTTDTFEFGKDYSLKPNNFIKRGFVFGGWKKK